MFMSSVPPFSKSYRFYFLSKSNKMRLLILRNALTKKNSFTPTLFIVFALSFSSFLLPLPQLSTYLFMNAYFKIYNMLAALIHRCVYIV